MPELKMFDADETKESKPKKKFNIGGLFKGVKDIRLKAPSLSSSSENTKLLRQMAEDLHDIKILLQQHTTRSDIHYRCARGADRYEKLLSTVLKKK